MAGSFLGGLVGGFGGGAIGSAVVQLFLDDDRYKAQLAAAQGQTATSTAAMGKSFSAFKALAGTAALAAGAAIVQFGAKAVEAASAQEEALNKVKVSFDSSSGVVTDFAETSAEAFGISKTAALQAAGGYGVMLQTAGLAADEAANMSVELVALASDLASFNDIAVEGADGALAKLRSGLAGEAEPLRTMGILLSETRVKAEAYASGIAKVGTELTEAQKVQARYNLILQDSRLAQGDFARTSDSLANTQRSLTAQFTDAQAVIGEALLPVVTDLLNVLVDLVPVLELVAELIPPLGFAAQGSLGPISDLSFVLGQLKGESGTLVGVLNQEAATQKKTAEARRAAAELSAAAVSVAQDVTAGSSGALGDALRDLERDQRAAADAAAEHTAELVKQRETELELVGGVLGLVTASTSYTDALDELNTLQRQGKEGTDAYREAQTEALNESIGFESAINDLATQINEGVVPSFADARDALVTFGREHGLAGEDLRTFIRDALDPVRERLQFLRRETETPYGYLFDGQTTPAFDAAYAKLLNARVLAGRFDPTGTGNFNGGIGNFDRDVADANRRNASRDVLI